ncbi:zf-HC2 domain-containing protein [Undibacterium sp. RuTC16W]|uniref:zf-HC2 domain-containing protein n=1 Tax=Undibacterium sp. RuTC16W TaxID=3413048 RepID=UPI003BF10C84
MRLLITCKQAHQMVSEGLDRHLSLGERARLKMHLSVCDGCTNFNGQMQLLRRAMRKLPLRDDSNDQDRTS